MKTTVLFICTLLLTFSVFAQNNNMSEADKANFKTVVLSKDKTGMPVIKKWVVPVRYKIYQGKAAYHSTEIDSILSKIKMLTGLDIAATSNDDDVNLSIFLGDQAEFSTQISNVAAQYFNQYGGNYYKFNNKNEIFQGLTLIPVANYNDQRDVRNSLRRNIIRLFGFLNPLETKPGSIFYSQSNGVVKFDNYDSSLIKLLYSPSFKPGMNLVQVDEILNKL
ncbi:MAG: DUF2927 domain-containing protein [Sphingobacteriaceae bacterium]|nr:MAG: DUF2927 domain-containing protein [Sphingobacteriaceae bacterium]